MRWKPHRPFAHYTPRVVAISNRRLVPLDAGSVSLPWKDYRAKGRTRHKTMTLTAEEFMRRFLLHVRLATCYSEYYKTCYEDHSYPIGCAICPASSATD